VSNLIESAAQWQLDAGTRLAPGTARNRTWLVRRLIRAAQRHHGPNVAPRQLCITCISQFLTEINEKGGTGNYNAAIGAIKDFVRFLRRNGDISINQSERLLEGRRTKKFTRQPKMFIPAEQFGNMLAPASPWDRGVLSFALYSLARQSEIRAVQLGHLDLGERAVLLYRLKRRRHTAVPITPTMRCELDRYLNWYAMRMHTTAAAMLADHPDWYLYPRMQVTHGFSNGRYDAKLFRWEPVPEVPPQRLERVIKRALDTLVPAGEDRVPGQYSWQQFKGEGMHTIRRSGARAMYLHLRETQGRDSAAIQVSLMLDHEDPKVTLAYIGMDEEREELHAWLRENDPYGLTTAPARRLTALG
jgi:integrase